MSNNYIIENLSNYKKFVPLIATWLHSEFIINKTNECTKRELINSLNNRPNNEIPMTLICLLDNRCIGTISIFLNDLKELHKLTPWLAALYVDKDFIAQGVGKLLIDRVEKESQKLGYNRLYLRTEEAHMYYEKLGWTNMLSTVDEYKQNTTVFYKDLV